jgi:serine/threonine-protein kinase
MERTSDAPPPSRINPPSERALGSIVSDRYQLRRELGRGGIAAVYVADHIYTGRSRALKLLLPHLVNNAMARERLLHEARMLARVRHPNVVEVVDAGPSDRGPYLVMERLRGRSLDSLIAARGVLTLNDVLYIGRHACDAIGGVHAAGLVHRDVKPGNLFVVKQDDGRKSLKLIDLGAACEIGAAENTITGTPEYIPPEILQGQKATPASDVYALGVTLFECLTGVVPYSGSLEDVLAKMRGPPPNLRRGRPDIAKPIAQVIHRAIALDPAERQQSGQELREELARAENEAAALATGDDVPPVSTAVTRAHVRAPFRAPVEFQFGELALEGMAEDISEKGLLLMTPQAFAVGTMITVRFPLPLTGEIVALGALVRWARPRHRKQCAVGVELVAVPDSIRKTIAKYVEETGAT